MTQRLVAVILLGSAVMLTPSPGEARQPTQLMLGDPAGRNVTFTFSEGHRGNGEISVETHQVGNPGAELSIRVDHNPTPLFSRTLTTDDCKYGNDGAQCRFVVAHSGSDYQLFVATFKRGRTAHIEVENAGVMQMTSDASLIGFTRRLKP